MTAGAQSGSPTNVAAPGPARATAQGADAPHGIGYYAAMVVGWGVVGFALDGLLSTAGADPLGVFRLLVGLNVVNDALVLPGASAVGVLVGRVLPRWLKLPVQVGLITTAVVSVYAYPLVAGYGKSLRAGPSRLPWDYAHNLAVVLAVVWTACAVVAALTWRRTRSSG